VIAFRYEQVPDAWVAKIAKQLDRPWGDVRQALADVAPLIIEYAEKRMKVLSD
jgi:hypothetical protein